MLVSHPMLYEQYANFFYQTVVLICEHNISSGTYGLTLNRLFSRKAQSEYEQVRQSSRLGSNTHSELCHRQSNLLFMLPPWCDRHWKTLCTAPYRINSPIKFSTHKAGLKSCVVCKYLACIGLMLCQSCWPKRALLEALLLLACSIEARLTAGTICIPFVWTSQQLLNNIKVHW